MNLLEEIEKAHRGEESRVTLAPMSPEEIAAEEELRRKGYRFAFGPSDMSRADFIHSLPDISGAADYEI